MNVSSMTFAAETLPALPPAWVAELVRFPDAARRTRLRSVTIADADAMDDRTLEAAVATSYASLFDTLQADAPWHPVRFWNFVPALRRKSASGRDRYHVFNAGRFAAFRKQYGGRSQFANNVATASAVGTSDHDLVVHCLARRRAGVPVDNPAQVRPYQYSQRYGHRPPCFARGTLIDETTLLVGGTASIVGEDSVHQDDLIAQAQQTLVNLSSLIVASGLAVDRPLDTFRSLRVYHPRAEDRDSLLGLLNESFPNVPNIEFVTAEICRAELLVEIEGVCGEALE